MKGFRLSAFADEYSSDFSKQIYALKKYGIEMIEIRGVNGKNVSDLTDHEAETAALMLKDNGIGISSIGSPAGKAHIRNFDEHFIKFKRIVRIAQIFGADKIRGFSFYCDPDKDKGKVFAALDKMIGECVKNGMLYCHENEKGIYGDTAQRCLEIINEFKGNIGCVFDPANFIQCSEDPQNAINMLYPYITYMHIKDAYEDGAVAAAGEGIGRIPELLKRFASDGRYPILTLEPHLKVFEGLSQLEGKERSNIQTAFSSNETAFEYAAVKLKNIIKTI